MPVARSPCWASLSHASAIVAAQADATQSSRTPTLGVMSSTWVTVSRDRPSYICTLTWP